MRRPHPAVTFVRAAVTLSRAAAGPTLCAAALASAAVPTAAQTLLTGRLLEAGTERPVSTGLVALLDTLHREVDHEVADPEGRFTLRAPGPGSYLLRAEALGYGALVEGPLQLEDSVVTRDFHLAPTPIALDPLEAVGERSLVPAYERRFLEIQGFYEREKMGFGDFLTPDDIAGMTLFELNDLFRRVPAVRVDGDVLEISGSRGWCRPVAFVNGIRVFDPVKVVEVDHVTAVEVYRRISSIPLQYSLTTRGLDCGVILLWTKA